MRALAGNHQVLPLSSIELDLLDAAAIRQTLRKLKPDLIVNAAGYTAVDQAESEPRLAMAINGTALATLGQEAARIGAAVVHFSTDYVFDGAKTAPYTPDDAPNPLSVYAQSKLAGERALVQSGASYLIIRTAWVYGARRHNFLLTMLQQGAAKPELRVVYDQIGCPTWCCPLAQAVSQIIDKSLARGKRGWSFGGRDGIYHLTGGGATTWFDFARRIFALSSLRPLPALIPISTNDYGAPAKRPSYSVLDCSKTTNAFDVTLPTWDASLQELFKTERAILPQPALSGLGATG